MNTLLGGGHTARLGADPLVCICRARYKAQDPRVSGKEGSVVFWTNSIFGVRSEDKLCFVTSSLCVIPI